ncbi:MAG TPA: hypothetical protein DCW60_02580 [Sutterella sp.]|nr:hypothetical protein [Sutterella sp.]
MPENLKPVLLHACCAPCSSAVIEWLSANGYHPTIFFANPNIFPKAEYNLRKKELIAYAARFGYEVIDSDWDHDAWRAEVAGLEAEPERGKRCLVCFKYRLIKAARAAHELSIPIFTTTLASSRWKSIDQVREAGLYAQSLFKDVTFWDKNWRKDGLQERRNTLVKTLGFYNQKYCGCEFSMGHLTPEELSEVLSRSDTES